MQYPVLQAQIILLYSNNFCTKTWRYTDQNIPFLFSVSQPYTQPAQCATYLAKNTATPSLLFSTAICKRLSYLVLRWNVLDPLAKVTRVFYYSGAHDQALQFHNQIFSQAVAVQTFSAEFGKATPSVFSNKWSVWHDER